MTKVKTYRQAVLESFATPDIEVPHEDENATLPVVEDAHRSLAFENGIRILTFNLILKVTKLKFEMNKLRESDLNTEDFKFDDGEFLGLLYETSFPSRVKRDLIDIRQNDNQAEKLFIRTPVKCLEDVIAIIASISNGYNDSIEELIFRDKSYISDRSEVFAYPAYEKLYKIFINNLQYTNIKVLSLAGSLFPVRDIKDFIPYSQLTHLSLGSMRVNNSDIIEIAKNLPGSSLNYLDLNYNSISDEGAKALADTMIGSSLNYLDLNYNSISDEGVQALAYALPYTRLNYLSLTNNKITDEALQVIAQNIKYSSLSCLFLNSQYITLEGERDFVSALENNFTLEYASINCTNFEDMELKNANQELLRSYLDRNKLIYEKSAELYRAHLKGVQELDNVSDDIMSNFSEDTKEAKLLQYIIARLKGEDYEINPELEVAYNTFFIKLESDYQYERVNEYGNSDYSEVELDADYATGDYEDEVSHDLNAIRTNIFTMLDLRDSSFQSLPHMLQQHYPLCMPAFFASSSQRTMHSLRERDPSAEAAADDEYGFDSMKKMFIFSGSSLSAGHHISQQLELNFPTFESNSQEYRGPEAAANGEYECEDFVFNFKDILPVVDTLPLPRTHFVDDEKIDLMGYEVNFDDGFKPTFLDDYGS